MEQNTDFADSAIENIRLVNEYMGLRNDNMKYSCFCLMVCKEKAYYKASCTTWEAYAASIGLTLKKANKMVLFAKVVSALEAQKNGEKVGEAPDFALEIGAVDEERLMNDWLPCVRYSKEGHKVENVDEALELLEQAKELSYSDFQKEKDLHVQKELCPDVKPIIKEGPVLTEDGKDIIGNYHTRKASGKVHHLAVNIEDEYLEQAIANGNAVKVLLGK